MLVMDLRSSNRDLKRRRLHHRTGCCLLLQRQCSARQLTSMARGLALSLGSQTCCHILCLVRPLLPPLLQCPHGCGAALIVCEVLMPVMKGCCREPLRSLSRPSTRSTHPSATLLTSPVSCFERCSRSTHLVAHTQMELVMSGRLVAQLRMLQINTPLQRQQSSASVLALCPRGRRGCSLLRLQV